uniref:Olfactory receptor n=1 Tax=Sus scrofa TaxID=9823 RepID=A0A8D0RUP5_PIG
LDSYKKTNCSFFYMLAFLTYIKFYIPIIYQVTLVGNGAILLAIGTEKRLHTPMYYFLANLALLDIFCPSTTLYFLVALVGTEVFLLSVMAYDRYVAICFPLRYTLIITKVRCVQLTVGTWTAGFLNSLLHTVSTFRLSFCKYNLVNQYYCDIPPVVALSCSSTYVAEMLILVEAGILGISAFLVTFISYFYIISTVLKIQSMKGKCKAFSTYASHLLVICLFGGTMIFTYVRPYSSQHSPGIDRLISMLYGIVTPILNPMIYSLRNTEVKGAVRRVLCHRTYLLQV